MTRAVRFWGLFFVAAIAGCGSVEDTPRSDCSPELSMYEPPLRKPNVRPSERIDLEPGEFVYASRFEYPPAAASRGLSYWAFGDEDVIIDTQLVAGTQAPRDGTLSGTVFLDGLQHRFLFATDDGRAETTVIEPIPLPPLASTRFRIEIPTAELSPSAYSANLVFWRPDGLAIGGQTVTILRDSATFAERATILGYEKRPRVFLRPLQVWNRATGRRLEGRIASEDFARTRSLNLWAEIQPHDSDCDDAVFRIVLVALLDGVQIEVGTLGLRPTLEVRGNERVELDFTVSDLPIDGEAHTLQFWLLFGDGQYNEGPPNVATVYWDKPQQIGWAIWRDGIDTPQE